MAFRVQIKTYRHRYTYVHTHIYTNVYVYMYKYYIYMYIHYQIYRIKKCEVDEDTQTQWRLQPVLELLLGHDVGVLALEDTSHAVGVVGEASRAPFHHVSPHRLVQRDVRVLGEGPGGSGVESKSEISVLLRP